MAETIVLYEPDDEDEEPIEIELSAGYKAILEDAVDESEELNNSRATLARGVEDLLHQSVRQMQQGDEEIHRAYALIVYYLEETQGIDMDLVAEQAIHTLNQQT